MEGGKAQVVSALDREQQANRDGRGGERVFPSEEALTGYPIPSGQLKLSTYKQQYMNHAGSIYIIRKKYTIKIKNKKARYEFKREKGGIHGRGWR